jgi:hypothetical protein
MLLPLQISLREDSDTPFCGVQRFDGSTTPRWTE